MRQIECPYFCAGGTYSLGTAEPPPKKKLIQLLDDDFLIFAPRRVRAIFVQQQAKSRCAPKCNRKLSLAVRPVSVPAFGCVPDNLSNRLFGCFFHLNFGDLDTATIAVFVSNPSVPIAPFDLGIAMNNGVSYINQFFEVRHLYRSVTTQRLIQYFELADEKRVTIATFLFLCLRPPVFHKPPDPMLETCHYADYSKMIRSRSQPIKYTSFAVKNRRCDLEVLLSKDFLPVPHLFIFRPCDCVKSQAMIRHDETVQIDPELVRNFDG